MARPISASRRSTSRTHGGSARRTATDPRRGRHHHARALPQRVDDRRGADVGVGRDERVAERFDRRARLVDREPAAGDDVQHVVAGDGRDRQAASPSSRATARTTAAPAMGLAAPMLVMMVTPIAAQAGSTARIRSASSGS